MNLEEIDTSTTAGKAEVMRLAAEGRRVAIRTHPFAHPAHPEGVALYPWVDSYGVEPIWDWRQSEYAIIAEPALDRPARVGGRDFPAGALIQQVIGRAHAEFDRHHHRRDPRDVASDPEGFLVYANGEPMMAAKRREPVGPNQVWILLNDGGAAVSLWSDTHPVNAVRYLRADLAGEAK